MFSQGPLPPERALLVLLLLYPSKKRDFEPENATLRPTKAKKLKNHETMPLRGVTTKILVKFELKPVQIRI